MTVLWSLVAPGEAAGPEAYRLNEAGVAEIRRGNLEAGIGLFNRALQIDPRDEAVRKNLARAQIQLGDRLLQAGQTQRAEEQYRASTQADPAEAAGWLGLGDAQLRRRDPRAALESFRRAVGVNPSSVEALALLGQAYYNLGDLDGAQAEWGRALRLDPANIDLRRRIAQAEREAKAQGGYRPRESQHFTVAYEGERREDIGQELLQILERAYADVGYELGAYPRSEVQTIFYSEAEFTSSHYGLLDGKIRVGLKGLAPGNPQLRSVLYHEYAHALIYAVSQGNNPPRWVHEGLAVYLEQQRGSGFKDEAIRRARAGQRDTLAAQPYLLGSVGVGLLIDRYGLSAVRTLLQRMGEGRSFGEAFQATLGMGPASFEQTVRDFVTRGY